MKGVLDINDVKVIESAGGLWVAMPSIPGPEGKRRSLVWLLDLGLKHAIEDAVLAKWRGAKSVQPAPLSRGAKVGQADPVSSGGFAEESPPF
jgi:DNA-binding cell septation regulator SpoVG